MYNKQSLARRIHSTEEGGHLADSGDDVQLECLMSLLCHYLHQRTSSSVGSDSTSHPSINISTPFDMPANVQELEGVLRQISVREGLSEQARVRLAQGILANFCSALAAARSPDRVTVMLLGKTGQGKSATINKLVGRRILETGRNRSTTKDIIRTTVDAVRDGIKIPVAFDDTPGLQDTQVKDRERNAIGLRLYRRSFAAPNNPTKVNDLLHFLEANGQGGYGRTLKETLRTSVYPNAVLTAKWENVQDEQGNPADKMTTPMGRTIQALHQSGLYDKKRPNAIILITKAIFSPLGDLGRHFEAEWEIEAKEKRRFIHHIQNLHFPQAAPWPVVFIENGSDPDSFGAYDFFPDHKQSHQNLFEELSTLFSRTDRNSGVKDLLGLQALSTVIAGVGPCIKGPVKKAVFVNGEWETVQEHSHYISPNPRLTLDSVSLLRELSTSILGRTYDPVKQRVGKGSCLAALERVQVVLDSGSTLESEWVHQTSHQKMIGIRTELGIHYTLPEQPGGSSVGSLSILHKTAGVAALLAPNGGFHASSSLKHLVKTLPPWDGNNETARSQYYYFFSNYGTHAITSAAMEGEISLDSAEALTSFELQTVMVALNARPHTSGLKSLNDVGKAQIGVRGGGRVDVVSALRQFLERPSLLDFQGWNETHSTWMEALCRDCSFLPHTSKSKYMPLHSLQGLTIQESQDLRRASRWYLEAYMPAQSARVQKRSSVETSPQAQSRSSHSSSVASWLQSVHGSPESTPSRASSQSSRDSRISVSSPRSQMRPLSPDSTVFSPAQYSITYQSPVRRPQTPFQVPARSPATRPTGLPSVSRSSSRRSSVLSSTLAPTMYQTSSRPAPVALAGQSHMRNVPQYPPQAGNSENWYPTQAPVRLVHYHQCFHQAHSGSVTADLPRSRNATQTDAIMAKGHQNFWEAVFANICGGLVVAAVGSIAGCVIQ